MLSRRAGGSFAASSDCRDTAKPCSLQIARRTAARLSAKVGRVVVPCAGRDLDPGTAVEARRQQGDNREQPEQAWRSASDGLVRPLPLGLDAQVIAHLAESDFELPALDEPADDLQRLLCRVGAEQGLRIEAPAGIAQQHPTDRHDWQAAVAPNGGVRAISTMRSPSPYQPGTVTRCHRVVLLASTSARVGRRSPLVRGRPIVPGWRGGAGR